jgi:hypothetical protein
VAEVTESRRALQAVVELLRDEGLPGPRRCYNERSRRIEEICESENPVDGNRADEPELVEEWSAAGREKDAAGQSRQSI